MEKRQREQLLTALALFGTACMAPIPQEQLNRDESGDARFLFALFLLGAADFVHQAENLTYGEFRQLALEMLSQLGWPSEGASTILDIANTLPRWGQKRLQYGEEAMIAGADAFRDYYLGKNSTAPLAAARLYVARWKGVDLSD
jgi:hypothetical protein